MQKFDIAVYLRKLWVTTDSNDLDKFSFPYEVDKEREENTKKLLEVKLSDDRVPEITMKDKIREMVNEYSASTNIKQQNVWQLLYKKLYYIYHISINSYKKLTPKESKLEVAERNGLLGKLFTIISDLIRDTKVA